MPFDPAEPTYLEVEGVVEMAVRYDYDYDDNDNPVFDPERLTDLVRKALISLGSRLPSSDRFEAYRDAIRELRGYE